MPELLFLGVALFALCGLPFITGMFAKSVGRSFWIWFGLGFILPLIATFILFFLPEKNKPVNEPKA